MLFYLFFFSVHQYNNKINIIKKDKVNCKMSLCEHLIKIIHIYFIFLFAYVNNKANKYNRYILTSYMYIIQHTRTYTTTLNEALPFRLYNFELSVLFYSANIETYQHPGMRLVTRMFLLFVKHSTQNTFAFQVEFPIVYLKYIFKLILSYNIFI